MRIWHTSDTHLGHQQYARTAPSGLNQREQDHYDGWTALIDAAVEERPDVFVHAGDLFDGVRPTNRALATALDGFLRLSKAGIPAVVIAGNHEHPRMRETGSPMRLLEHLEGVHVAYRGVAETFHLAGGTFHAVPQCASGDDLAAQVAGLQRGAGPNVLILHGAVHALAAFSHAEFNELSLEPSWFDERFDYVALGHFHGTTQVADRAWYCGAPDRVSIKESGEEKGWLDVHVAKDAEPEVRFRPLLGRPYADLPAIDARGMDGATVVRAAGEAIAKIPEGAVARLRVQELSADLRGTIDVRAIHDAGSHLLQLDLRLEFLDDEVAVQGPPEIGGLQAELEQFAAKHPIEDLERKRVLQMARELLEGA